MAALPSPTQVAGVQYAVYETYFNQLEKHGLISAVEGAKFLKKSGLSDTILSRIWDVSDPNSKGYLTKAGFFTALKLVSLAQLGHEINVANILMDIPPPNMGSIHRGSQPTINSVSPTVNDWSMKPSEKAKYDQLFDSLQPLNGVIPGNKVKGLLIDSKLPVTTLGKIWDLADMDKDGSLDRHEFIVAMHLVYKALEKYTIPNTLPPELLPPNKRKNSVQSNSSQPTSQSLINGGVIWVVTPEDKAKFDQLFQLTDLDQDGYVSGPEIKDIFLQSGVPQTVLANIWGLCDIKQSGKLNADQFALAMWLISQKLKGIDPPVTLAPDMVPPSMRPVLNQEPVVTPYSNPELNMISQDIDGLSRERQVLDGEIVQKESNIKVKISEANSLQGELETLVATLKQLENQKGEAQKRLNDLKSQTVESEKELITLSSLIELEQTQVDKLRKDAEEQALLVRSQEDELLNRRKELDALLLEENKLKQEHLEQSKKLNLLCNNLQESQLNISQIRTVIVNIQEQQKQLIEAIEFIDSAMENNDNTSIPNRILELEPQFRDPDNRRLVLKTEDIDDDNSNVNEITSGSQNIEFSENVFSHDPFSSNNTKFSSAFTKIKTEDDHFDQNDPFTSLNTNTISVKADPFDPFGNGGASRTIKTEDDFNADPFGCEPFEVAAPALPPKNKQPPPRPAPPRPLPPSAASTTAASASNPTTNQTDAFADFSNFNSKFCNNSSDSTNSDHNSNNRFTSTASPATTTSTTLDTTRKHINNNNICNINNNNNNSNNNCNSNHNSNADKINTPIKMETVETAEFEFTEDPFKDYRYEDTFDYSDDPFDSGLSNNIFQTENHSLSTNNAATDAKKSDNFKKFLS